MPRFTAVLLVAPITPGAGAAVSAPTAHSSGVPVRPLAPDGYGRGEGHPS
ncbi:hypothetical protein ACFW1A_04650 [Kitasatospora sp. NPDC058965]